MSEHPAKSGGAAAFAVIGIAGLLLGTAAVKFMPRLRLLIQRERKQEYEA